MQQLVATIPPLGLTRRKRFQNRHDILFDRHFAKDRFFLRQITHAQAGPFVHRVVRHVGVAKNHPPAIWSHQANDHIKTRGLPRAIWAEQSHDLTRVDVHIDSVNDRAAAIDLDQLISIKNGLRLRRDRRSSFRNRNRRGLADHGVGRAGAATD